LSNPVTVVVSAAGLGTRLGLNRPKALVEIGGSSILEQQLKALPPDIEVVVVAGFQATAVLELVKKTRPTTIVALNHEFSTTGTGASLAKGAALGNDWIVSLDGDLLVSDVDLQRFIQAPGPLLGLTERRTTAPVCAQLDDTGEHVLSLSQHHLSPLEWTGLTKFRKETARSLGPGHVFPWLNAQLPMPWTMISSIEIDEPQDLEQAEAWLAGKRGDVQK
jgi:choline kinase